MKKLQLAITTAVCLLAFAAIGSAQTPYIDYLGYGWETGGYPPSDPDDVLEFTCVADFIDPAFEIDLSGLELTFHIHGLVSTGEVDLGGGNTMVSFTGGQLDIYMDNNMDADWGTFPPNTVSPATFTNGILFFSGPFTSYNMYIGSTGSGSYEGTLDGVAGWVLNNICSDCAYTWGGVFDGSTGAQIPDGYDLQMDGVFEIDGSVAGETQTWSDVKALYR